MASTVYKISSQSLKMKIRRIDVSSSGSSHNESGSSHETSTEETETSSTTSSSGPSTSPKPEMTNGAGKLAKTKGDELVDGDEADSIVDESPDVSGSDQSEERSPSPTVPDGQYEVEKIVDYSRDENGDLYLVKWKNWEAEFNTWEPPRNLVNCEAVMLEFYHARKALYEKVLSETEYIVTVNGRKRRRGDPLPQVPPDPRPMEEKIEEFFAKYGVMTDDEINACQKRLAGKKKLESRPLGPKQTKLLHLALDDKLEQEETARLRKQLLEEEYIRKKVEHTSVLKTWEDEIFKVSKGTPKISVENDVDWEGPPADFTYIIDYLPSSGIVIPDDPPFGCDCKTNCADKSSCCSANAGTKHAYTSAGRLRVPVGSPIYECNKKCKCDSTCPNRVVQDGQELANMHFCIFRTNNGRGWGVKTLKSIKKGTFVTLYVGEVINTEEAERRGKTYDREGQTYLFDLDFNEDQGEEGESCPYTVDAAQYGNVAHFINHSCDPNLGVFAVWVNCLDPNLPKLALFAIQDICKGEEICFDYMNLILDHRTKTTKECKCGSKSCRKFVF